MLDRGKSTQIGADFCQYLFHRNQAQTIDAGEVNTSPVGQYLAHVVFFALFAARARCLIQFLIHK